MSTTATTTTERPRMTRSASRQAAAALSSTVKVASSVDLEPIKDVESKGKEKIKIENDSIKMVEDSTQKNTRKRKNQPTTDDEIKSKTNGTTSSKSSKSNEAVDTSSSKPSNSVQKTAIPTTKTKQVKKSEETATSSSKSSKIASKRKINIKKEEINVDEEDEDQEEEEEEVSSDETNRKKKTSNTKQRGTKATKNSKKSNAKKSKKQEEDEDNDDDDEEEHTTAKNIPIKEEEESDIKTIKFSGEIPIDENFAESFGNDYRIYQEGSVIYDCSLNQTNLQFNNNKYYLIQLLECKKSKKYIVWMRWGRVGKKGQTSSENCGSDIDKAKDIFCKKFYDKTKNDWPPSKDSFEKYPGKYDLVERDYSSSSSIENANNKNESNEKKQENEIEIPESKLDKRVQNLIELICNVTEMEKLLKELKFDSKKAPLGKLSKSQIKAGYAALKEIEALINNKDFGPNFIQANNDFYTRIPHDFGMKTPPLIRTLSQMREKMKLLEVLDDIEVAVKALNQESEIENPIDRHYDQLECNLKPIGPDHKMYKIIEDYLTKNHGPTHTEYKLKLLEAFEVEKPGEKERFKNVGNRMLLWHGSRLTNWAGILSQGLRIAPPEAPVTGYMFGKGCYFADCSTKSANYCFTTSNKNTGLLSLSEVSLGISNELKNADYDADKHLPNGKSSTKGLGKSEPDKNEWITLDDGCVIPVGKLKPADAKDARNYSLLYNEYIVYNVAQVKLKYLVKCEFVY